MWNKGYMYMLFKRCQESKSLLTSNFANLINFSDNHEEFDLKNYPWNGSSLISIPFVLSKIWLRQESIMKKYIDG